MVHQPLDLEALSVCVCVCVCVRERERERETPCVVAGVSVNVREETPCQRRQHQVVRKTKPRTTKVTITQ